ncbi:MAG: hypothetical protein BECKG1743F_GA0114225_102204, partial [Candidatus Kentron sp. G]
FFVFYFPQTAIPEQFMLQRELAGIAGQSPKREPCRRRGGGWPGRERYRRRPRLSRGGASSKLCHIESISRLHPGGLTGYKAISIKEYTNLLVFIVQLGRCNNSYIVHDAPAARLESGRKSCAIRYILFCQSPKQVSMPPGSDRAAAIGAPVEVPFPEAGDRRTG